MKPLFLLALLFFPAAAWAIGGRPCNELEYQVIQLDRKITCDNARGNGANVNDELERNFLLQLHQSAGCYDVKFAANVLRGRANACGNARPQRNGY